jgi:DNA-binding transcriptional ArsR family regulator
MSHTLCDIVEDGDDLDGLLGALADPTRRRVIELLGAGPRRAGDLAAGVGMAPTALSRHLQVLRSSGLVTAEPVPGDARGRVYQLAPERLVAVRAWIDEVEAFWSEQLGSFKAHAERTRGRDRGRAR